MNHETSWSPPKAMGEAVELWMMMQFPDTPGIETDYHDYDNGLMIYAWRARLGETSYTLRATRQVLSRAQSPSPEQVVAFLDENKIAQRLANDPKEWVCIGEDRRTGRLKLLDDTRPPKARSQ